MVAAAAACFCAVLQGSLDIVLTAKFSNGSVPKLVFLQSDVSGDTCFLKVTGEQLLLSVPLLYSIAWDRL